MEIGWFCDTPYQIISCLAYVLSHSDENDRFDLYIVHQFVNSERIEKNIREMGIFRNIISFRPYGDEKGIVGKARKCFRFISPRRWLNGARDVRADICPIPEQYDLLYVSVWTIWNVALCCFVKIKRVNFFEEGTASYCQNSFDVRTRTKIIHRMLGRDLDKLKPQALYLNNPGLCQTKIDCPIYPFQGLAKIDSAGMEKIYQAFDYKRNGYYAQFPIIYLTQPNDTGISCMEEIDNNILDLLAKYGKDLLVRRHPRQKNISKEGVVTDTFQDMWELVCEDQISNDHVLVGIFSTAQITPVIFYNKEPYLVFLYNLYPGLLPRMQGEILGFIERIRHSYSRPEKVFLPNTLEELRDCMDQIMEDRCQNEQ